MRETPKGSAFSHIAAADGGEVASVASRRRPFLCAAYLVNEGAPRPAVGINRCPWAGGGEECTPSDHSWRKRKTGPQFPLRVMRCGVHARHFTVYPPAFVPYARRCLAPVDMAGHALQAAEGAPARERWRATIFRGFCGGFRRRPVAA